MATGSVRGFTALTAFLGLTVPLMPVQAVLLRLAPNSARRFPRWYHRQVCKIIGVTLKIEGEVAHDRPVLLVSNHTSWLDIPVLSAVAPVSFVAKLEVGGWPFVSALARLQRSVFVDRTRRQAAGDGAREISRRLTEGDAIILFAEGTSSDGNRVLPFKTSLFGAVEGLGEDLSSRVAVQTVAVVYTHMRGVPVTRADRPRIGWYGDMEMTSHAWGVLKSGGLTATIKIGAPVALSAYGSRKTLALESERAVRRDVVGLLRGRPGDPDLIPVEPTEDARREKRVLARQSSEKWT
ncbi:1-acyl-sn-glycerol-3-phosphate acyltransferase [Hyphomicrobium methylovorum]|uniref:lysophospholipid acyltransferase family protein n=1 Tax=Hyphomicrobium methylovorum TaxID=84 RepID=UPI0015E6CEE0|nr:lysophospholipid acyltransferase family protein [Hyphomicrobium methylovorum]MBA2126373.1 1-acyl-sn-glycerol-3-phosphate acyltransferase [Hyphomicrobium methylovorum]